MTLHELVTEMTEAVISGVSLQHSVRDVCEEVDITKESRANSIANAVTSFRSGIQTYVTAVEDEKEIRNKKVNNIINDVSRICKAELGYSIKCVSRKGGHVYKAQEYIKDISHVSLPTLPVSSHIASEPSELDKLRKSVELLSKSLKTWREWQEDHEGMLKWLIKQVGYEQAGKLMIQVLKEHQEEKGD